MLDEGVSSGVSTEMTKQSCFNLKSMKRRKHKSKYIPDSGSDVSGADVRMKEQTEIIHTKILDDSGDKNNESMLKQNVQTREVRKDPSVTTNGSLDTCTYKKVISGFTPVGSIHDIFDFNFIEDAASDMSIDQNILLEEPEPHIEQHVENTINQSNDEDALVEKDTPEQSKRLCFTCSLKAKKRGEKGKGKRGD